MTLEEERVEVPFDERDQLVEAARWFSEDPDSMGAWRALNDAVEAARPVHTDPLDDAVRTIASLREDKADPQTIARAFLDLQSRLRAAKPLEVASLVNPNPPGVQWLIDGWLLWGRAALLAGDGGLGKRPAGAQARGGHSGGRARLARWHYYCPGRQETAAADRRSRQCRDSHMGGRPR